MQTIAQKILAAAAAGAQAGYQAAVAGRTLYVQSSDAGNVLTITLTDAFGNRETVQNVGAGAKMTPAAGFTAVSITTTADSNVAFIVTQGDIDIQLNQTAVSIANGNTNPVPVAIVSEPGSPFPVTVTGTVNVSGATLTATNVGINNTSANPVPVSLVSEPGAPVQVSAPASAPVAVQVQPPASAPADVSPVTVPAYAAWVASTAYALNAYAMNGGNLYQVTTAGTSAASGGPTGTGASIADGSVVWKYVQTGGGTVLIAANAARKGLRVRNAGAGQLAITAALTTTFAQAAVVIQPGDTYIERDAPQAAWFAISDTGTTANIQTVS
ncbi:hypothetical protein [Burkholderia cepacia]|uniref:hypothetical protein n=1 Tax=Burkholderia cepacia TaxID=292 RepID=UPI001CF3A10D|nr:hypothetical protein [Burkholderia cepacia]MCA8355184.1 hypothetical protein [Burkholderia cepacia]